MPRMRHAAAGVAGRLPVESFFKPVGWFAVRFCRCLVIIICLLGWVAVCLGAADETNSAAPRLTTPETEWDFGDVTAGAKPEHEFVVENTGNAPLAIRRVLESCGGCFRIELAQQELGPGERTTLTVVVLTARRKGSFRKYLFLESNDRAAGRRRITVTGTITPPDDGSDDDEQTLEEELEAEITLDPEPVTTRRGQAPVRITYFTSSTCEECRATHNMLCKLQDAHPSIEVREFDTVNDEALNLLYEMANVYGEPKAKSPPFIYVGTELIDGWDDVKTKLASTVRARLDDGTAGEWPSEIARAIAGESSDHDFIRERFLSYRALAVAGAGLVDGINPCAFATLVFFVSLLARFGKSRRETLTVGACFTLAVFVAYFLIGVGLLLAIKAYSVKAGIARAITCTVAALTAVLGAYSIYDYIVWRRTRSGSGMKLKLPRAIHTRIHAVMKAGLSARSLVVAALVTGVCVSVLESICTGQVLVPTLTYVLRDPALRLHALSYLVLYCVMFILPLVVIFALAYFGLESATLARLAQRHTGTVKLLLAAVFFGLAVLLLLTASHTSITGSP
ncbi:MAG: DUF1573 domain-containing protein [Verrucomicrobia bacterium]|nr:DUF1573 domain-containing protein [Verrucomicrobiota bacterium]